MIIMIILLSVFIISVAVTIAVDVKKIAIPTLLESLLAPTFIFTGIAIFILVIYILVVQFCGVNVEVYNAKVEYNSLKKRVEYIKDDTCDIAVKNEIIKEIDRWNIKTKEEQYYSKSLWTNWFYNKEVSSEKKIIEY